MIFRKKGLSRLFAAVLTIVMLVSHMLTNATHVKAAEQAVTIQPIADCCVEESMPDENRNATDYNQLFVRPNTETKQDGKKAEQVYMKFDISELPVVADNAEINLVLPNKTEDGQHGCAVDICKVSEEWDESTITWNNKPEPGDIITSFAVPDIGTSAEIKINLTDYIKELQDAGKTVADFAFIANTSNSNWERWHRLVFRDKEYEWAKPSLQYTVKTAEEETTDNGIFVAAADAYIDSNNAKADVNYGLQADMYLKEGGGEYNRRVFLKFKLSGVDGFNSAILNLYFSEAYTQEDEISLYAVEDTSWDEKSITYNNQPEHSQEAVATTVVGKRDGWYAFDITQYVLEQKEYGKDEVSFVLIGSASDSNREITSIEGNADYAPNVVIANDTVAPVLETAEVSNENKTITLTFNEVIANNANDLAALKSNISLATAGDSYVPLTDGDEIAIDNNKLIINLNERLTVANVKVKISAFSIADTRGNAIGTETVAENMTYDVEAPVLNTEAVLNPSGNVVIISANENLINATTDLNALKAGIWYCLENFEALDDEVQVAIKDGKLEIEFPSKITTNFKIKINADMLKDAAGNKNAEYLSNELVLDTESPEFVSGAISYFNKKITLLFNEDISTDKTAEELKNAITVSENNGEFKPLEETDEVMVSGKGITIIRKNAVDVGTITFTIAAKTISDMAGNIAAEAVTSGNITVSNVEYPYAPPSEKSLAEAMIDTKNITFSNKLNSSGEASEMQRSGALATIAIAIASGNRDEQYINRYVESIRKMLTTPENMPNLQSGLEGRTQSPLLFAMSMLWNDEDVMSHFTEAEMSKMNTFLKASLISAAYTLSDYDENDAVRDANRIGVNGDPNCWNGGNANFSEPNCTTLYSAALMLGLENVRDILNEFKFDAFVQELKDQGLTTIYDSFVSTYTYEGLAQKANQDTLAYKANMMEKIVKSDKWSFKGVSMDELLTNPMKLYEATQRIMWVHIAEDGDYMGQKGMALEFDTTDDGGVRECANYVTFGIDPCLINRILLDYYGYFSSEENKTVSEEIDSLQKVGISDYYAKVINGYFSQSWMGTYTEFSMENSFFKYIKDTMISLGFMNIAIFNDTFNYSDVPVTSQWILSGDEWEVRKNTIIPYNTKDKPNGLGTTFDPNEQVISVNADDDYSIAYTAKVFGNVNYNVWVKQTGAGEVGIAGRVKDADNYYLLSYDGSKLAIKKVVDGNVTTIIEKEEALTENAHRFRGVFTDNTIEFYVDGVKQLECTDDTFVNGAVGLLAKGTVADFDGVLVQPTKPDVPELQSVEVGNGQLQLKFSEVEGTLKYKVQYGTKSGEYTNTMYTTSTTPIVRNLENDVEYYFVVSSETTTGMSENSNELSGIPRVPTAVTPIINSAIADDRKVILHFTTDPVNTSYKIKYGTVSGDYTSAISSDTRTGVVEVEVPYSGVEYYFVVSGVNDRGEGLTSNEVSCATNSNILFTDEFNDGEYLSDWILSSGSFTLDEANGKIVTAKNNPDRLLLKYGEQWNDYEVTTTFSFANNTEDKSVAVLVRTNTSASYYVMGYEYENGKGQARFRLKNNGAFTIEKAYDFALDETVSEHSLKADVLGDKFTLYIDGELVYEVQDSTLTSGNVGLFSTFQPVVFDDLKIEKLNALLKPELADVTKVNDTTANLKFNKVDGATGYKIKYGLLSHGYTNEIVVTDISDSGVDIANLSAAKYYFVVSAFNDRDESENSVERMLDLTKSNEPTQDPEKPSQPPQDETEDNNKPTQDPEKPSQPSQDETGDNNKPAQKPETQTQMKQDAPTTGDDSNFVIPIVMLLISVFVLVGLCVRRYRRKTNNNK